MTNKTIILDKLEQFVKQRPGLDFANYGSNQGRVCADGTALAAYRSDTRYITKYYAPCLFLIDKARQDTALKSEQIAETAKQTFSGRLTWEETRQEWNYTTGQYWPTEYRMAAWTLLKKLMGCYSDHPSFKSL